MAKADSHLSIELINVFFLRRRVGCLSSKEIDTWKDHCQRIKRVEFFGGSESNSMYSPRHIACLVLSGTCADRQGRLVVKMRMVKRLVAGPN